jgi:prepilin-type N-terminal cleavage/methylation domain-containing protein
VTAGLGSGRGAFARRSRDENARDEEGFTLVEILITVVLIGLIMVTFMGALFTMVRTSDVNNRTTQAEAELRSYSEALRAYPFKKCWTKAQYQIALDPAGTTYPGAQLNSVTYWDSSRALGDFAASCDATKNSVQRIQLQVSIGTSPTITETTTIDKRSNQVGAGT